jgi:peroxiredoxin
MKRSWLLVLFVIVAFLGRSQQGYDIRINFKGCPDSAVYLARYFFDRMPVEDSCKTIRDGKIRFKGDRPLEKGVYFLANQARNSFYFQFIVDDKQHLTLNLDAADLAASLKSVDDPQNELFFGYVRFMTGKNKEMSQVQSQARGKKPADSARLVLQRYEALNAEIAAYDEAFRKKHKGLFVADLINMKAEKYPQTVPLAANGRPDSVYQYYYYKNHFFDGVDFRDERVLNTPFFADRIKKYFEQVIVQHPDSVIRELDNILSRCEPGSTLFNTLVGHFTYKYEQNKAMSFDQYGRTNTFEKVFVHLADKYIVSGKTGDYYSPETIANIREKVDVLRHLLPDAKVPDLFMIDTLYGRQVLRMGFDTAQSSISVTNLYNSNARRLQPMYKTLYEVKARYTVLVFWAADCSHCTTELPKLHEELMKLKGISDVRVYAVQTKSDLFDKWKAFIAEKQLTDFIHVFDPIHLNNLKEQFDITATPVIYLLDKDKRIKAKKLNHDQVVEIIQKLDSIEKNYGNN